MTCHEPSTGDTSLMITGSIEVMQSAVAYLMQFPQLRCQTYPIEPLISAVVPDSLEPRLPAAHMYSA